jgi:hypothetical protein
MPMIPGRFTIPNTEVFGYYIQDKLIAWSMYRIWDDENIVIQVIVINNTELLDENGFVNNLRSEYRQAFEGWHQL